MKYKKVEMEKSEKRFLYSATLREALEASYSDEEDEKKRKTTSMHTPLWIRKVLADLRDAYNLPFYVVSSRTLRLGVSLLQKEYGERLDKMRKEWHELRWSDNFILTHMEEIEFTVNGTSELKRKTFVLPIWCDNVLNSITGSVNVNKSAMLRLAIYLALMQDDNDLISENNKKHAEREIVHFNKLINDSIEFLEVNTPYFGEKKK